MALWVFYDIQVSRLDVVFMIDCDEAKAMDKLLRKGRTSNKPEHSMSAVTTKMNYFKGIIIHSDTQHYSNFQINMI
jgi:hypothetical protein